MNKDFEDKVKLIHDYFHSYGLRKTGGVIESHDEMLAMMSDPNKKNDFIKYVHEGFRLGQDILIAELIQNEKSRKELNGELKEHRKNRDKEKADEIGFEIKKLEYMEAVLRNLADSLAWLLMNGQHWIARRWYSGSRSRPSLLNSNIESLHIAAASYYKQHPNGFALYSDLTSFVDIGDLIVITEEGQLKSVEVKEGSKSKEVFKFMDKHKNSKDFKPETLGLDKHDNPMKFLDQVERTIRQMEKGSRLTNLIKNEKGPDPFTGQNTVIGEISHPLEFYHDVVFSMFQELKTSIWSHRVIEGIVYVGMYRNTAIRKSTNTFESFISTKFEEKFPVMPYNSQLFAPIKEPIFQKPYGTDNIMSIVLGRTVMLVCVDLNALLQLFNSNGIEAKWMSRKETQKSKETGAKFPKPFEFNKQAISVVKDGKKLILGDGFLSRLVYDSLLPSSLVETYQDRLAPQSDEEE